MTARFRVVDWLPLALVVVAEAAWISVVDGLLQEFVLRAPSLGIPVLAAFVVLGVVVARLAGRRAGRWWPLLALVLICIAGAVGGLSAPAARAALDDGPGAAVAVNPGGWIAGLAVLRGFAHARMPLDEGTVARLLGLGIPAIACFAILGGAIVEPFRTRFLADTVVASILFAGASLLALTLARLGAVAQGSGFDWRRNPTWLGLTVVVLAVAIVVAVPLSAVAGVAIQALFAIAFLPLVVVGLMLGVDGTARRVLGFVLGAAVLVTVLATLFPADDRDPAAPPAGSAGTQQPPVADQILTAGIGGLLLVVAIVVVIVLAIVWMRRTHPAADDLVAESRRIDRGSEPRALPRRRRRVGRRPEPASAAEAYVALVDDLEKHAEVRRRAGETPAEHAARLRVAGRSDVRLDLLAADYALTRYGGVPLSEREHRRAVGRWRLLRRRLPHPPARPPGARGSSAGG